MKKLWFELHFFQCKKIPWENAIWILAIQIGFLATTIRFESEAPALQVVEHARAVLEDDRKEGIQRSDPILKKIARARDEHSVFCLR